MFNFLFLKWDMQFITFNQRKLTLRQISYYKMYLLHMLLELYFHQIFTIDILTLLAIKSENISSYIVS